MKIYTTGANIITSLGFNIQKNVAQIENDNIGIKLDNSNLFAPSLLPLSCVNNETLGNKSKKINNHTSYTRFEKLLILSIEDALEQASIDITSEKTGIIISTTKGNIDLLEERNKDLFPAERIYLWKSAQIIQEYLKNPNAPIIISNACISGVVGIITAMRLIDSGRYDHVVVTGGDIMSKFVVSGFLSFMSLDINPCKPFDKNREGLTLGEGAGTIILSSGRHNDKYKAIFVNGSCSNDANHISGPSRTGEGLLIAIKNTIKEDKNIDYISAHGTGTLYNDDMESKALKRAGIANVPVNSFKGYFGHTLGAAGIIETILGIYSMENNVLFRTANYEEFGVAENINVISTTRAEDIKTVLKTASGFGGCNAALLIKKGMK